MGYKHDQNAFDATYRPSQARPSASQTGPPPLPPRANSTFEAPPAYVETATVYHSQPLTQSWSAQDPRASSTESLVPHPSVEGNGKRRLLLVYVHGFMGNETSFQSFPAHVHNAVTEKLRESHEVHTKIYPRYKSRNRIEVARDAFSDWLGPHESPDTDVILLGHSMGGLLSAEVVLLKSVAMESTKEFQHRILGTINFDTPFLGMHPGVIASGLGSLFRPAPDSPALTPSEGQQGFQDSPVPMTESASSTAPSAYSLGSNTSSNTLNPTESSSSLRQHTPSLDLPTEDPNYNPPFPNDVRIPRRTGWSNAWHFVNKHSDSLARATKTYVTSHLEFGGCLADYNGLMNRYSKLRGLEDVDPAKGERVRFVNYYTASTGRPKKVKEASVGESERAEARRASNDGTREIETNVQGLDLKEEGSTPSICIEELGGETSLRDPSSKQQSDNALIDNEATAPASQLLEQDPEPISEKESEDNQTFEHLQPTKSSTSSTLSTTSTTSPPPSLAPSLPPLPPLPTEPLPFDPSLYTDKETLKLASKEHSRAMKNHLRLLKDHERAIKDRKKLSSKLEKAAEKDRAKKSKSEKKECDKRKENPPLPLSTQPTTNDDPTKPHEKPHPNKQKPPRDKKFCLLPSSSSSSTNNGPDPTWVRVFMQGVDEVGAHCGLFCPDGERYEWFVGDVARRVGGWVC